MAICGHRLLARGVSHHRFPLAQMTRADADWALSFPDDPLLETNGEGHSS